MNALRMNNYVRSSCADSSGNVYIGGDFSLINGTYYWGIAKWNGTQWDSLGSAMHIAGQSLTGSYGARGLAFYKNHIYAGGHFTNIQGKPIRYIAKWDGSTWDSLPQSPNADADRLVVCNNKLYVFGAFNKIGTTNCNKMAVWDGTVWTPIWMPYSISTLDDVVEYNGELYVGGNFSSATASVNLMKFDGVNWLPVGGGILGSLSWVNALKVFNNELYIGGYFQKGAGNAGDFLMKWDGTSYHEVIGGLNNQIWNLTGVSDGLIATGCFTNPYNYVLKIGNNGVCGYNDVFNNCIQGSVYANNKLYFYGGFTTVNGDSTMGYISNVNYTSQTDSCLAFLNGVEEINKINVKIYPNPVISIINMVDENNRLQNASIEIKNYLGQVVFTTPFTSQINLSNLSAGMYFLTIQDNSSKKTIKIIKE